MYAGVKERKTTSIPLKEISAIMLDFLPLRLNLRGSASIGRADSVYRSATRERSVKIYIAVKSSY